MKVVVYSLYAVFLLLIYPCTQIKKTVVYGRGTVMVIEKCAQKYCSPVGIYVHIFIETYMAVINVYYSTSRAFTFHSHSHRRRIYTEE